jgi:hypothetical protein
LEIGASSWFVVEVDVAAAVAVVRRGGPAVVGATLF